MHNEQGNDFRPCLLKRGQVSHKVVSEESPICGAPRCDFEGQQFRRQLRKSGEVEEMRLDNEYWYVHQDKMEHPLLTLRLDFSSNSRHESSRSKLPSGQLYQSPVLMRVGFGIFRLGGAGMTVDFGCAGSTGID